MQLFFNGKRIRFRKARSRLANIELARNDVSDQALAVFSESLDFTPRASDGRLCLAKTPIHKLHDRHLFHQGWYDYGRAEKLIVVKPQESGTSRAQSRGAAPKVGADHRCPKDIAQETHVDWVRFLENRVVGTHDAIEPGAKPRARYSLAVD